MRYIETIKIVDGKCLNLEYHSRRAGFRIEEPEVGKEFAHGVVKWRILYGDGLPVQSMMTHYCLPHIASLCVVDGAGISYSQKYEDRSAIDTLMSLRGCCDDIIIVRKGQIGDSSFCNLVFENSDGLFTPASPMLAGTKRQILLDKGIIVERDITVDEIKDFCCVRLVNAMIELEDNITIPLNKILL